MNLESAVDYLHGPCQDDFVTQEAGDEALGVIFYVIGDRFQQFSDGNVILPYSQAIEHITIVAQIARCVVVGQGVSIAEVENLKEKIHMACGIRHVNLIHRLNQKISKHLVDKENDKNVLITSPEQKSPCEYQCSLVVDDDCNEMSDCSPAEHIQGILLIEAAKQMFMACARVYDITAQLPLALDTPRFTLSGMDVRFDNFVFPLAAKLNLTLNAVNVSGSTAKGCATVKVFQFGKLCCEINFHANAYSLKFFTSLERRSAIKTKRRMDYNKVYI